MAHYLSYITTINKYHRENAEAKKSAVICACHFLLHRDKKLPR